MRNKLINKVAKKKAEGCCYFCGLEDYCALDVHRIVEGKDGGEYTDFNTVTTCVLCHRRIHDKQIVIDRKYYSTAGKWVLYFFENGEEKWL